ncbi:1,4-alpha-glucan branching protein GlgB [Eubacterium oxidoreducens]|uniref:1,4-alpha-glucan branching enzyme GlgB n=1 Tax=Eubacterium oxidoreducens TaxID=1732 RepID=A0A1G6C7V9_EUBOX|nr:1,4-alpha-glucan branching protein GlgB [Eubacterium oxidoreducens]SDB28969.1 1,4-alpha-glucan branching enzyme [Eubacterium oxidoreducens]
MSGFSEYDMYLFGNGRHYEIYKKLGAHYDERDGASGVRFSVWAPHAHRVWVIGEFTDWQAQDEYAMQRLEPLGIYELFVPGRVNGEMYKYLIETQDGRRIYKADPYASYAELRPGTSSKIFDSSSYKWKDTKWMNKRKKIDSSKDIPMAIYEVHPASWKRHFTTDEGIEGMYTYRELAQSLCEYIKEMGYTHVELMGISEYPFDGSWGYQVTGYYAPTSRYGTPEDFKYFVDTMHKNNIGVILDWVPAHFPKDEAGLREFDGEPLYEYPDPRMGEHPDWGTKIFNYGKNEVCNFLIGSALNWIEEFHVDGLRVDAVASMLYLDYGKKDGGWIANKYGGNENLEAVEFFRHLNTLVLGRNPGTFMIAEESTAWPKITGEAADGGLNFSYKWNMGWMHDFLDYMKLDPIMRKGSHNKMTFGMSYNESEDYILVLSHDEVVHLKCSMLNKMPGFKTDKFRNLKAGYAFMLGHPGKKLLFMGQEFGQEREWAEERELDWYLLDDPEHADLRLFVKGLLGIYKKYPCLYTNERKWDAFEWINANDADRSIFSFVRKSPTGKKNLLFVVNFTPVERNDYRVGVPKKGKYKLIYTQDMQLNELLIESKDYTFEAELSECDGRDYSIAYPLTGYGVAVFHYN